MEHAGLRLGWVVALALVSSGCVTNGQLVELCEDQNETYAKCGFDELPDCASYGGWEPSLAQQAELICMYRCQIDASCEELSAYACVAPAEEAATAIARCLVDCTDIASESFESLGRPEPCSSAGGAGGAEP